MQCKICTGEKIQKIYDGKIRNGGLGHYTSENVEVFQCQNCNVIWHENIIRDLDDYYESADYRNQLEGGSEESLFYKLHDKESLDKLNYTGTDIFRNKIVADIGAGGGSFLDFIKGVAKEIIAVEPMQEYREILEKKGYKTFAYAEGAIQLYAGKVDVITNFDVIEHVENPLLFLKDMYKLMHKGSVGIVGTPTDAPMMRELLGEVYEKQLLFSTQHLWIFSEESLKIMAKESGFTDISVKYYQRYGMDNMLGWVRDKKAKSEINFKNKEIMNKFWKAQLEENKMADYMVLYLKK